MVKPDHWIVEQATKRGMIEPFEASQVGGSSISFGPSSYGYDMRVFREFRLYEPVDGVVLDPKQPPVESFREIEADICEIPAGSFVLARSLEYFRIPRDVLTICTGKSTYARCGVVVNVTPFEPEWEGYVTMSISNTAPSPVRIYSGEGIAQVIFLGAEEECETSYADRKGKYQGQQRIVMPRTESPEPENGS